MSCKVSEEGGWTHNEGLGLKERRVGRIELRSVELLGQAHLNARMARLRPSE